MFYFQNWSFTDIFYLHVEHNNSDWLSGKTWNINIEMLKQQTHVDKWSHVLVILSHNPWNRNRLVILLTEEAWKQIWWD